MPFFLDKRQNHLKELMDDPRCDLRKLENTYRSFKTINKLLSGWKTIYKSQIRPFLKRNSGTASILDIGFGGGDVSILLSELAKKDGFHLEITAIDIDERSFNFVQKIDTPDNIIFRKSNSASLVAEHNKFDFIISNHVTHHLNKDSFLSLCDDAEQLALQKILFNDIERSDFGYLFFFLFSKLFFRDSFISYDGLISIKRSYTFQELQEEAPPGWQVNHLFPFRLVLSYECE